MKNQYDIGDTAARVAIIGAGAAGLVAAREFRREGHAVEVFEQQSDIGGVWVLDKGEPSALEQTQAKIHTSMYDDLRVNLPREVMSFSDLPFIPLYMQGRSVDPRRFPHHIEVRQYLEAFADRFEVKDAVHLNTRVIRVRPLQVSDKETESRTRWEVTTEAVSHRAADEASDETVHEVDAVVICNGHYTVPRLPQIEGLDSYPGVIEHSHLYRRPDKYCGKRVLVVGAFASGEDIAWEIAPHAKSVTLSAKTWMQPHYAEQHDTFGVKNNMSRQPWVSRMNADASIDLEDGTLLEDIDVVLFCTGYQYSLPFLQEGLVDWSRSHVRPLYQQLLHPCYGCSLSFIGLGYRNIPFIQCEIQSKYVASLLSGKAHTPSQEVMEGWVQHEDRVREDEGTLDRHVHSMALAQFPYNDALAAQCGGTKTPPWRLALIMHTMELWEKYSAIEYRDMWEDEEALHSTSEYFSTIPNCNVNSASVKQ